MSSLDDAERMAGEIGRVVAHYRRGLIDGGMELDDAWAHASELEARLWDPILDAHERTPSFATFSALFALVASLQATTGQAPNVSEILDTIAALGIRIPFVTVEGARELAEKGLFTPEDVAQAFTVRAERGQAG